jgi:predicted dehydrogenase
MDNQIIMGVIGCGHWGPNHIRNFSSLQGCRVKWACDLDANRLNTIRETFPSVQTTTKITDVVGDNTVNGVIVSTPTLTHYEVTKMCLEHGKDVLCEKPLTVRVDESEELVRIANERNRILMVGHVFLFNIGIQKLKEYIRSGDIGRVYYIHATRTNLGPIRQDVNAVLDLASHDVSIFNFLLDCEPLQVSARGESYLQAGIEDVAFITLVYPNKTLANIHVSWLDPKKERVITVVGEKKMITWDDMVNSEPPLRIYNKGVDREQKEPYYKDYGEFQLLLRDEEIIIPKIKLSEPLRNQSLHFLECLQKAARPISGGEFGRGVVKVLAAINLSLKRNGQPVIIDEQQGCGK